MENKILNYCTVENRTFTTEDGEVIAYSVILWHIGKSVLELKPSKSAKSAIQVLVDAGLVDLEGE